MVDLIDNPNPSFWKRESIGVIKIQAELRGRRFEDIETKGIDKEGNIGKKIKKKDYLDALFEILKILNK